LVRIDWLNDSETVNYFCRFCVYTLVD